MSMSSFFGAMQQATSSAQLAGDTEGRAIAPYLATVTNNEDPLGARRIKVTDPVMPGLETYWLRRLAVSQRVDAPLPEIGSTVMVFSVDGDTLNGWWLECLNDTNPPLDKADPLRDLHSVVKGEQSDRVDKGLTVSVGKTITFANDAGASITLAESGDVIIEDASGNRISLAGGISFSTGSLSVAGKQITTVGAVDTSGDNLTSKGW